MYLAIKVFIIILTKKKIIKTSSVFFILALFISYLFLIKDLPSPKKLEGYQLVSSKIYDRNGTLLFRLFKDENRTPITLKQVSPHLINAVISIEDQDFYEHYGFSITGIIRSFWFNLTGRDSDSIRGGSTITQQLVKNRLLTPEKTYIRKIKEIILAIKVEHSYTKDQILEMYLNHIAFGGTNYGVEEASWFYFNKSAKDLNLPESALLAGLPQAPTRYNPRGKTPELAYARMSRVLKRMREEKFISEEEFETAKKTTFDLNAEIHRIRAPHFVMFIKDKLLNRYSEKQIYEGGLQIKTTLDLDFHNKVQSILTQGVDNFFRLWVSNGATIVTKPASGEIISMVGSRDYFDVDNDGNVNVTLSLRQPGSTIKPLTYAMAIENGKAPQSILKDTPAIFKALNGTPYAPRNNDYTFRGNVTLRQALGSSYNLPAVKELVQIGVDNYVNKAKTLGINTWPNKDEFDFGLTLGGGEVRMIDMAQMFSVFPNYGYDVPPNPIIEITDFKGKSIYKNNCILEKKFCHNGRKFSKKATVFITDILSDNKARKIAFGSSSELQIGDHKIAVKTGTTNYTRDNWTIGYTSDHVVAVWIGNNQNTPMRFIHSGMRGASTIWREIMSLLVDDEKPHHFHYPEGFTKVDICKETGILPCSSCKNVITEIFVRGTEPKNDCNSFVPMSMK